MPILIRETIIRANLENGEKDVLKDDQTPAPSIVESDPGLSDRIQKLLFLKLKERDER